MTIHGISTGTAALEPPRSIERTGAQGREGGDAFSVEVKEGAERLLHRPAVDREGRRRAPVRSGRRVSEHHGNDEQRVAEAARADRRERGAGQRYGASEPQQQDDEPEASDDEEDTERFEHSADPDPGQDGALSAASAFADSGRRRSGAYCAPRDGEQGDLGALRAQLQRLREEPQGEVTLLLPALGRVTARAVPEGVAVEMAVPLRQLAALQRAREGLEKSLAAAGLQVASVTLRVLPDPFGGLDAPDESAPRRDARGLVDVLA